MDSSDPNIPEIRLGEGRLTSIDIESQVTQSVELDHGAVVFNGREHTVTIHGLGVSYFAVNPDMFKKLMNRRAVLSIKFLLDK